MAENPADRRRRFVYVTKNTEYFIFDNTCVAVRDRRSGEFVSGHRAVAQRLEGGAQIFDNGAVVPTLKRPIPGEPMYFTVGRRDEREEQLVTSCLQDVTRPAMSELDRYPVV